ncbi:glycosyltransferase 61 family protein [Seohaeicola saemankumensis]|uniref:Glycosyltransferase 61 family protein n=1 Tax=Seohaeicola saemankumensis TaxID=481181 RepID=A0ABW3TBL9_9RHOB
MPINRSISFRPLTQLIFQRLGLDRSAAESAAETVIICPHEENLVAQAFYLEGQLDRVTGVSENNSFELEKTRITQRVRRDDATVAYRIDNCVFSSGRLLTHRMQDRQGGRRKRKPLASITDTLETAVLPMSHYATFYFGHMVIDGGASSLLAPEFGKSYIDTQVAKGMGGHAARYWDLFNLKYTAVEDVRIRHAWIFDDRGMNSHKIARLRKMNSLVRTIPAARSGHGIFFRRRGWGVHRAPENEAQLEDFFAERNFEIIDPGEMSVDEMVPRIREADVIIGVEGSGMIHGMLAIRPDAIVVMMLPPWRLNNMMKDYADGLGLRYGFVVGEGGVDGYWIDPEEILRTIDLAIK